MKRTVVAMLMGAFALSGVSAREASAQCDPASPLCKGGVFVIDGNIPDTGTLQTIDPAGSTRELGPLNGNDTKVGVINAAIPPMLGVTNPNGQVDLNAIWTRTALGTDGHVWFYFGWARDANTGSGVLSIELQKSGIPPACDYSSSNATLIAGCNPWSGRSDGDFLLLWDQQGGAKTIAKRVFHNVGGVLVLGPAITLGTAKAEFSADGFRGEAAVDFTVDVFPTDGSCVSFANTIPGTVTGNSDTADYKDAVLSAFPPVTNCGTVKVKKVTDPTGLTGPAGGFAYKLARSAGALLRFDGTTEINGTLSGHGDSDTYADLIIASNYTLAETAPTLPWSFVSTACVIQRASGDVSTGTGGTGIAVEAGSVTECTITNKLLQGTITVVKTVVNDNGGTAVPGDFTMFLGAGNPSFSGVSGTGTTTTLAAGTAFAVTESNNPDYTATIGAGAGDVCSGTMVAGATYICHVVNDDKPAHLIIIKNVINDNGLTKVAGDFSGNITGVTAVGGNTWTGTVTPGVDKTLSSVGTYNVTENAAAGYTTSYSADCSGTIALGQTKTCTVTNNDNPASPAGTTVQKVFLHDAISIPAIRDLAPNKAAATATFRLYTDNACSVPVQVSGAPYAEAVTLSYGAPTGGLVTGGAATSTGVTVNQPAGPTTFYWTVQYSGDSFNTGFTTKCGVETTTLDVK